MTEHRIEVIIFFLKVLTSYYACMNVTAETCMMILDVNCSLNESAIHQKRQEQLLNITCNTVNCIGTLFYENKFQSTFYHAGRISTYLWTYADLPCCLQT